MMASSLGRITLTSLGFGKDLSQSADYRSEEEETGNDRTRRSILGSVHPRKFELGRELLKSSKTAENCLNIQARKTKINIKSPRQLTNRQRDSDCHFLSS